MRKLFLIVFMCFLGTVLSAQVIPGKEIDRTSTEGMSVQQYELYRLHLDQNNILKNRKTALTISVISLGIDVLGTMTEAPFLLAVGGLGTIVGGVWMITNEYRLINNQTKINEHVMLELNPSGVKLRF